MFAKALHGEFLKLDEIIGVAQLMARWPQECCLKIAYMLHDKELVTEKEKQNANLTLYMGGQMLKNQDGDLVIGLNPCPLHATHYPVFAEHFFRLFFRLSDVEAIERAFPNYRLVEVELEHRDDLLVCRPSNINRLALITLNYMMDYHNLTEGLDLYQVNQSYYILEAQRLAEVKLPEEGPETLTDEKLWPILPLNPYEGPKPEARPDLDRVNQLIEALRRLGQNNDYILAWHVDNLYPGLSNDQLGDLLPAKKERKNDQKIGNNSRTIKSLEKQTPEDEYQRNTSVTASGERL